MKSLIVAATGIALALSAAAAVGQSTGGSSPTSAPTTTPTPTPTPTPVPTSSPVKVATAPTQIHLKNAVIQNGKGGNTLNAGFTTIDGTQRLTCSSACTIVVSAMVQVKTTGNWAICAVVDGNNINPPCPFQGLLPQKGSYVTGNSQQSWAVSAGTHTVQTQVYVSAPTTLGNWQTTRQTASTLTNSSPATP